MFQSPDKEGWQKSKVIQKLTEHSLITQAENGTSYRRNRVLIRGAPCYNHEQVDHADQYDFVTPVCAVPVHIENADALTYLNRSQRNRRPPACLGDCQV